MLPSRDMKKLVNSWTKSVLDTGPNWGPDQRHLKRLVADKNRLFVNKVTKAMNQSLAHPVSRRTGFNYLKKPGYQYKIKLKKQGLSAKHRQAKVEWSKRYAHFAKFNWQNVIFTDESTFYVLQRKNQVKI